MPNGDCPSEIHRRPKVFEEKQIHFQLKLKEAETEHNKKGNFGAPSPIMLQYKVGRDAQRQTPLIFRKQ